MINWLYRNFIYRVYMRRNLANNTQNDSPHVISTLPITKFGKHWFPGINFNSLSLQIITLTRHIITTLIPAQPLPTFTQHSTPNKQLHTWPLHGLFMKKVVFVLKTSKPFSQAVLCPDSPCSWKTLPHSRPTLKASFGWGTRLSLGLKGKQSSYILL